MTTRKAESDLAYPARLRSEPEGGSTVTFPDLGFGVTYGATREEALRQAAGLLETIVANCLAEGWEVPPPSAARGRPLVALDPLVAIKVELYRTMRAAGITK